MSSLTVKRAVATALAGAAIASSIGATAAAARPESVPPPPSSIAASAASEYEDLRAPAADAPQPVAATASEPSGFDLPSAAIGAATAAGLLIVLLTVGGLTRRRSHGTIGA